MANVVEWKVDEEEIRWRKETAFWMLVSDTKSSFSAAYFKGFLNGRLTNKKNEVVNYLKDTDYSDKHISELVAAPIDLVKKSRSLLQSGASMNALLDAEDDERWCDEIESKMSESEKEEIENRIKKSVNEQTARLLISRGIYSDEMIMQATNLTLEELTEQKKIEQDFRNGETVTKELRGERKRIQEDTMRKLFLGGNFSDESVARIVDLPLEDVLEYKACFMNNNAEQG